MGKIANPARARLSQGELALGMGVRAVRGVEVARVMKTARMLHEVTSMSDFATLEGKVRRVLGTIDERVLEER